MTNELERLLIVEELKQYTYCRRIAYYQRCLPGIRPRTFSMEAGKEDHLEARQNARRRTFAQMGFEQGRREFDVVISAPELNLRGRLDEVVTTDAGEVIPVEYKGARKVAANHKVQVAAYAVLLETARTVTVQRAYIYLIPLRKAQVMVVTPEAKAQVRELVAEMTLMVAHETMPAPTPVRSRCAGCEFRRFCNDV